MKTLKSILTAVGIAALSIAIAGNAQITYSIKYSKNLLGLEYMVFIAIASPIIFLLLRNQRLKTRYKPIFTWLIWLPILTIMIAAGPYFIIDANNPRTLTPTNQKTYNYPKPDWAPDVCDCMENIKRPTAYFDPTIQEACEMHVSQLSKWEKFERLSEAQDRGCISSSDFE